MCYLLLKVGKYHGEKNHMKMHREKLHSTDEPPVSLMSNHINIVLTQLAGSTKFLF